MYCVNCGKKIKDNMDICFSCGKNVANNNYFHDLEIKNLPDKFKPISAWGYFGYQLLFAIPIIGWIFLIIFALKEENINLRNFAKSYFCFLLLCIIGYLIFTM